MTARLRRLGARPEAPTLEEVRARALDAAMGDLAALLVAARAAYARALRVEEPTVIALACEVARAVLGREASSGPEVLRDVTSRAVARVRRARVVALRVHPDDVATAEREARRWLPEGMESAELLVTGDPAVGRGGVVVETELGRVDARLERQVEEVARILDGSGGVV